MLIKLLMIIIFTINQSNTARILGVFPYPSYSHQISFQTICKALAQRGHEVTVITTDPLNDQTIPNLQEVDLHFSYDFMEEMWNKNSGSKTQLHGFDMVWQIYQILTVLTEQQLKHKDVQKLVQNQTEQYDLVMADWAFPVTYGFSARFKCPIVGLITLEIPDVLHYAVGNPVHPVLHPYPLLPFGGNMNFVERILSVVFSIQLFRSYYYELFPDADLWVRKYIDSNSPPVYEIAKNVSLLVSMVNPFFTNPRPNLPFVIEVSGIHLKPLKPLPKDIQNFLDDATEGAIYVSFGSSIKSAMLPIKLKNMMSEVLKELPYKVLWKYEDSNVTSSNKIKVSKWFPQQDILAHRNIKLFIMQGGHQSLEEAISRRVPVIGIPFHIDQPKNAAKIVANGIGLALDKSSVTKDQLKWTIQEVINNPKYRKNIEDIAVKFEDQPMKPLDKIIWWVEYVIRHNGTKHLRNEERANMPLYKFLFLDILLFIMFLFIVILLICTKIVKLLLKKCCFNLKQKIN